MSVFFEIHTLGCGPQIWHRKINSFANQNGSDPESTTESQPIDLKNETTEKIEQSFGPDLLKSNDITQVDLQVYDFFGREWQSFRKDPASPEWSYLNDPEEKSSDWNSRKLKKDRDSRLKQYISNFKGILLSGSPVALTKINNPSDPENGYYTWTIGDPAKADKYGSYRVVLKKISQTKSRELTVNRSKQLELQTSPQDITIDRGKVVITPIPIPPNLEQPALSNDNLRAIYTTLAGFLRSYEGRDSFDYRKAGDFQKYIDYLIGEIKKNEKGENLLINTIISALTETQTVKVEDKDKQAFVLKALEKIKSEVGKKATQDILQLTEFEKELNKGKGEKDPKPYDVVKRLNDLIVEPVTAYRLQQEFLSRYKDVNQERYTEIRTLLTQAAIARNDVSEKAIKTFLDEKAELPRDIRKTRDFNLIQGNREDNASLNQNNELLLPSLEREVLSLCVRLGIDTEDLIRKGSGSSFFRFGRNDKITMKELIQISRYAPPEDEKIDWKSYVRNLALLNDLKGERGGVMRDFLALMSALKGVREKPADTLDRVISQEKQGTKLQSLKIGSVEYKLNENPLLQFFEANQNAVERNNVLSGTLRLPGWTRFLDVSVQEENGKLIFTSTNNNINITFTSGLNEIKVEKFVNNGKTVNIKNSPLVRQSAGRDPSLITDIEVNQDDTDYYLEFNGAGKPILRSKADR